MAVLVTGAGGFVGSHLVEQLDAQGKEVTCFLEEDSQEEFISPEKYDYVRGDIADEDDVAAAVAGHDRVYHLAALRTYRNPSPEEYHAVNVRGTEHVMRAAVRHDVDKVVYTSSKVTIGATEEPLSERMRHTGFFANHYALTKYKGEKIAFEYGARGIDVTTVHPTLIYGPRDTNTLAPLIRRHVRSPVRFASFTDTVVDLVYVDDVVKSHIAAMESGRPGERYLIGGEEITIGEFLSLVDSITETQKPLISLPRYVIEAGVMLNPVLKLCGIDPPLSTVQVDAMRTSTHTDSAKVEDEWDISTTLLKEGLTTTVNWYKKHGILT